MKQAIADVINYINANGVTSGGFVEPYQTLQTVRTMLQSILSKSEDKEDVEFVYVPVSVNNKKYEPEIGLNIVRGENPDHLVESYYDGNGKWVITDADEQIDISEWHQPTKQLLLQA